MRKNTQLGSCAFTSRNATSTRASRCMRRLSHKCREMKIAGATVFRGLEGYGETAEMHRSHLARHDQPILISIVDSADNLGRLVPVVEEMMDTGLLAVSDVKVVRVQKKVPTQDGKGD